MKSLAVSIALTGNGTSLIAAATALGTRSFGLVKATFGVARVTKVSETRIVFHTLEPNLAIMINERGATLKLMDPATGAVLESAFLCASSVDCGALHVKGSEEEELVEKAKVALAAAAERRRLNPDTSPRKRSLDDCTDPSSDDREAWECECLQDMQETCVQDDECILKLMCCGNAAVSVCDEWKDENCGAYPGCKRRALYSTVSPPLWSEARQPHSRSHTHLTTRPLSPPAGAGRRPVRRGAGRDLRRLARGDHLLRGGAARLPRRLELLGDALHRRLRPRPRQAPPLREDVRRVRRRERRPGGVAAAAREMQPVAEPGPFYNRDFGVRVCARTRIYYSRFSVTS